MNADVKGQAGHGIRCLLVLCVVLTSVCACGAVTAPAAEECMQPAAKRLALAQRDLTLGEQSLAAGQYAQAVGQFKEGLVRLGDKYAMKTSLDDTGQRLALAAVEERTGRLEVAAHLTRNALATRASLYARKLGQGPNALVCRGGH